MKRSVEKRLEGIERQVERTGPEDPPVKWILVSLSGRETPEECVNALQAEAEAGYAATGRASWSPKEVSLFEMTPDGRFICRHCGQEHFAEEVAHE